MFNIEDRTSCCKLKHILTFPSGKPVVARMLKPKEVEHQRVQVGRFFSNGRARHVIIQAEYYGSTRAFSVDSSHLIEALSLVNDIHFESLRSDNTEYFRSKVLQNISLSIQSKGVTKVYADAAAQFAWKKYTDNEYEEAIAKLSLSLTSRRGARPLNERWNVLGVLSKARLKNLKSQNEYLFNRVVILQARFPRELKFELDKISSLCHLVSRMQIGIFPSDFPKPKSNSSSSNGRVLTTLIRKTESAAQNLALPYTLFIIEREGSLPTFAFRLKGKVALFDHSGAEKRVTPLLVFQGNKVRLQSDVTVKNPTVVSYNALEFQRKAATVCNVVASIYESPFVYKQKRTIPDGLQVSSLGVSAREDEAPSRIFVRMNYYPADLYNYMRSSHRNRKLLPNFMRSASKLFAYFQENNLVYLDLKQENVLVRNHRAKFTDFTEVYLVGSKIHPNTSTPHLRSPEWGKVSMKRIRESAIRRSRAHGDEESKDSDVTLDSSLESVTPVVRVSSDDTLLTVKNSLMVWQFGILLAETFSLEDPVFLKPLLNGRVKMHMHYDSSAFISSLDVSNIKIKDIFREHLISCVAPTQYANYLHHFCLRLSRECLRGEETRISLSNLIRALNLFEKIYNKPEVFFKNSAALTSVSTSASSDSIDASTLLERIKDEDADFSLILDELDAKDNLASLVTEQ